MHGALSKAFEKTDLVAYDLMTVLIRMYIRTYSL